LKHFIFLLSAKLFLAMPFKPGHGEETATYVVKWMNVKFTKPEVDDLKLIELNTKLQREQSAWFKR